MKISFYATFCITHSLERLPLSQLQQHLQLQLFSRYISSALTMFSPINKSGVQQSAPSGLCELCQQPRAQNHYRSCVGKNATSIVGVGEVTVPLALVREKGLDSAKIRFICLCDNADSGKPCFTPFETLTSVKRHMTVSKSTWLGLDGYKVRNCLFSFY
jgi:hypothetical protein